MSDKVVNYDDGIDVRLNEILVRVQQEIDYPSGDVDRFLKRLEKTLCYHRSFKELGESVNWNTRLVQDEIDELIEEYQDYMFPLILRP